MGEKVSKAVKATGGAVSGALVGAGAGAVGGAAVGFHYGAADAVVDMEDIKKSLLHATVELNDDGINKLKAICARLSEWVYWRGSILVEITAAEGKDAAPACFDVENLFPTEDVDEVKPDLLIPDRKVLPLMDHKKIHDVEVYQVRCDSMNVWVKAQHCDIIYEPTVEEQEAKAEVRTLLKDQEGLLGDGEDVLKGMLLHAGTLSPSCAMVILELKVPQPDGGSKKERVMCFVWQGTMMEERPVDLLTDLSAAPVRSIYWNKLCPDLWVHGAIYAKTQSDILGYEDEVKKLIKEWLKAGEDYDSRIVFSGHSLGGGIALVAHMCALGIAEKTDDDFNLEHIQLNSIAFASPMVFYDRCPKADSDGFHTLQKIKEKFKEDSHLFVCDLDIVPRLPGMPNFYKPAIRKAATFTAEKLVRERIGKDISLVGRNVQQLAHHIMEVLIGGQAIDKTFKELEKYSHFSQVYYYKFTKEKTLEISNFQEDNNFGECKVDLMYLLACHSHVHKCIKLQSATRCCRIDGCNRQPIGRFHCCKTCRISNGKEHGPVCNLLEALREASKNKDRLILEEKLKEANKLNLPHAWIAKHVADLRALQEEIELSELRGDRIEGHFT